MRTGRVAIGEILNNSKKSLRASDYVANPKKIALTTVRLWTMEHGGVLNLRSPAGKRLIALVEGAVREGMGKK